MYSKLLFEMSIPYPESFLYANICLLILNKLFYRPRHEIDLNGSTSMVPIGHPLYAIFFSEDEQTQTPLARYMRVFLSLLLDIKYPMRRRLRYQFVRKGQGKMWNVLTIINARFDMRPCRECACFACARAEFSFLVPRAEAGIVYFFFSRFDRSSRAGRTRRR